MDQIKIQGGIPLKGDIHIAGAKNAALPLMTACLLTDEPFNLKNIPHLLDVSSMANLLQNHGVKIRLDGASPGGHIGRTIGFNASHVNNLTAPYDIVRKMRASILVLGPLLAKYGKAVISQPGGCAIGTRPIDLHIQAMRALGATVELKDGYVHAEAPKGGLVGAEITFPVISVGATENLMLAAVLAKGETTLTNAAREPEVCDLAKCLNSMGAKITGIGTDKLHIIGVDKLHGTDYEVMPDRIEIGTYAIAAAITKGKLTLKNVQGSLIQSLLTHLTNIGIKITQNGADLEVAYNPKSPLKAIDVKTEAFPGFPTDLQAQIMTLLTISDGASVITENIFENRFMHVPELLRMGANITVDGKSAIVRGVQQLKGAPVMATDLRASVSLILAGLAAEGETQVNRVYHLDRGYERIEQKLANCGAKIERVKISE